MVRDRDWFRGMGRDRVWVSDMVWVRDWDRVRVRGRGRHP